MTTWKLRESIENGVEAGQQYGSPQAATVEESVLAITEDEEGTALGRWVVMGMDQSGRQECHAKGKVVRYVYLQCSISQNIQKHLAHSRLLLSDISMCIQRYCKNPSRSALGQQNHNDVPRV